MDAWSGWVRRVVLGRRNGVRAAIRRELNIATWLDDQPAPPDERRERAEPADKGWERVASVTELPGEGELFEVFADDRPLVLARVDGELHALDSVCPHAGGPLGDGELDGPKLTCPWHGWSFDVRTGECGVDAAARLDSFVVRIEGDDVLVAPRS